MYRYMYYSPFSWIPVVFGILFWVLVVALIVSLIKHAGRHYSYEDESSGEDKNTRYLNIVKERYVKGEISREKYRELKDEFSGYEEDEKDEEEPKEEKEK